MGGYTPLYRDKVQDIRLISQPWPRRRCEAAVGCRELFGAPSMKGHHTFYSESS